MYLHSRQGKLAYPQNTMEIADIIGHCRWEKNIKTRKNNPNYDMGNEKENLRVDVNGVFAELVAQHFFCKDFIKYWSAPLYADNKQTGSDIHLLAVNGKPNCFIDVKALKKSAYVFGVDKPKFDKNKMVDTYFFVQKASDHPDDHCVADYWVIDSVEIAKWEVFKRPNGTEYYGRKIKDHLASLGIEGL